VLDKPYVEKPTYRSEIIAVLRLLGGQATLKEIYATIKQRDVLPAIHSNPNWSANVRWQLQSDSSDSKTRKQGQDLFYSANGIGGGVWGLRNFEQLDSDETFDFIANGEYAESEIVEGIQKTIKVNTFERSRVLRHKCLDIYGTDCNICKFDFEKFYGVRGLGFIEVHHIIPFSIVRREYTVAPSDLRPVCSNCHSIIHRFKPFLTIEEMVNLIAFARRHL
jgi:predicted HNH restriction endonuclease